MARKLLGGFPANLDLDANYIIRFTAVDPTTGATVAGVNVSNAVILVDNVGGGQLGTEGSADEPLWLDLPIGDPGDGGG